MLPTAWDERVAPGFRIELPGDEVDVAIDGEPVRLTLPLDLESLPRTLRVLVPSEIR